MCLIHAFHFANEANVTSVGGTGGLAMAERLSQNPAISVAVIEAGSAYQVGDLFE